METLYLETPEGVDLRREVAGPGSRSAAAVLDLLVLGLTYLLLWILALVLLSVDPLGLSSVFVGLLAGGSLLLLVGYPAVMAIKFDGRTVGKMALGLRVVGDEGYPAEPMQHVLRALLWPVEFILMVPVPLGLILVGTTPTRQRLGDMVAGTMVVREGRETQSTRREPFPKQTWSGLDKRELELSAAVVAPLDGSDVDLLRSVLLRTRIAPGARRRLFRRTADHYAERLSLGNYADSRIVLKELYLFLRERRAS